MRKTMPETIIRVFQTMHRNAEMVGQREKVPFSIQKRVDKKCAAINSLRSTCAAE